MTRAAVRKVCHHYHENEAFHCGPGTGKKRSTTQRDDRFIVSTSLNNRRLSTVELRRQFCEIKTVSISR